MFRYLLLLGILVFVLLAGSCRKDFDFPNNTGALEFSKDTIYLDTVFSNIGSSTYSFKVYNRSNDDIQIPSVRLEKGNDSRYRLNVNGTAGKEFVNVPILANDSIFIFLETTFDVAPTNEFSFLYIDNLLFTSGSLAQTVPLVTLVKDAVFLYPKKLADGTKETLLIAIDESGNKTKVSGFVLEDEELNFTNEKAYVIYGYATVAATKTLIINAGARVHFHKDSGIIIQEEGSLKINGSLSTDKETLENEVVFEGDRLEPEFSNIPGQWGFIWLMQGSVSNEINHLTLNNASVGILVEGDVVLDSPTLTLKNSQIYNSASINLWGRNTFIEAENVVLGNASVHSFYGNLGGSYSFKHCTIANYWNESFRNSAALKLDNFLNSDSDQQLNGDLQKADFSNCIIDGATAIELSLASNTINSFNYTFTNCAIKFQDNGNLFSTNPLYNFQDSAIFSDVLINIETHFLATSRQDYRLTSSSEVLDFGERNTAMEIPNDILGNNRIISPDLGAFEFIPEN